MKKKEKCTKVFSMGKVTVNVREIYTFGIHITRTHTLPCREAVTCVCNKCTKMYISYFDGYIHYRTCSISLNVYSFMLYNYIHSLTRKDL